MYIHICIYIYNCIHTYIVGRLIYCIIGVKNIKFKIKNMKKHVFLRI